ncbi:MULTISPECIES: DUF732 domain-containing protein [Nocardiaceae]|uniref:DUF732 domain-containing protein n=1 Tax=Nocardiaceae TaxID=85025 RepID=UPI0012FA7824|nr:MULTISPECIES: DUF732 domain-containing protein [Rhodococcus]MCC8930769.1 DUF732 domain-containing protein [Rhodococcus sp. I2R]MDJ0470955.1 DUF732 domain-containing protein [Rhodococcus fascians]
MSKATNDSLKREMVLGGLFLVTIAVVLIVGSNWQSIKPIFDDHPSSSELAASSSEIAKNMADYAAAAAESSARRPAPTAPTYTAPSTAVPRASSGSGSSLDGAFVQTLIDYDISFSSFSQAVSTAKTTCRVIGDSPDPGGAIVAASEIAQQTGGYTRADANDFVGIAVTAYCPEYNSYVQN